MTTEETQNPAKLAAIHPFMVEAGETYVTVRRGERWMGYPTGTPVQLILQDPENREHSVVVGLGVIQRRLSCPFNLIEARHIEMEHEITSRLYSGLLESMRRAYGDDFAQDETVTVVFYTVTEFDAEAQDEFMFALEPVAFTAGDKRAEFGDMPADERADHEGGTGQTMAEEFTASEKALEAAKLNPVLEGQGERAKAIGRAIQGAHVDHGLAAAEAALRETQAPAEEPETPPTPPWTSSPFAPPITPPVQDDDFGC